MAISLQRRGFYVRAELAQNRLVRASRRSSVPPRRPRPRARNAGFTVALVALPDAAISTLTGLYEVMGVPTSPETGTAHPPLSLDIVGDGARPRQPSRRPPLLGPRPVR